MTGRLVAVLVCKDRQVSHWELPTPPVGWSLCVLGWKVSPASLDAGVPKAAAIVFGDALAKVATVSFFARPGQPSTLHRLLSLRAVPRLRQTRDPREIEELFDDDYFHWSQKAQAAFLSPPLAPRPSLGIEDIKHALGGESYTQFRARNVLGVLVPGVDGDVAGLYTTDAGFRHHICSSLEETVVARGAEFLVTDQEQFDRMLADG